MLLCGGLCSEYTAGGGCCDAGLVLGDGRVLADEEPVGGLHGVLAGAPGVLDALQAAGELYCTAGWVLAG